MILECRTFGPNGKLKYVKSPEECATHFYRDIEGINLEKLKPK